MLDLRALWTQGENTGRVSRKESTSGSGYKVRVQKINLVLPPPARCLHVRAGIRDHF